MSKKDADISCGATEKSSFDSGKTSKKNKKGKSTTGKPSKGGKSITSTGATATEAEPVIEEEAPAQRLFLAEPETDCDIYEFGPDVGFANCIGGKNIVCDVICLNGGSPNIPQAICNKKFRWEHDVITCV